MYPRFSAEQLDEVRAELDPPLERAPAGVAGRRAGSRIALWTQTLYTQAALFAVEVALYPARRVVG